MTDEEKIKEWTPLVYKLAGKYAKKASKTIIQFEDLVSVGQMAILEAYNTLDEEKASLMTRMYSLICHRMQNEISENTFLTKGHVNFLMRLKKAYRELGENATDEEIEAWSKKTHKHPSTRLTKNNIQDYKNMIGIIHVSKDILNDEGKIYNNYFTTESNIEEDVDYKLKLEMIHKYLEYMKPIEKEVILGRMNGETLEELAITNNCTREWIRQVEKKAMEKLQKYVTRRKIPKACKVYNYEQEPKKCLIKKTLPTKFIPDYEYFNEELTMIYDCEYKLSSTAFKIFQFLKRNINVTQTSIAKNVHHSIKSVNDHLKILKHHNMIDHEYRVKDREEWILDGIGDKLIKNAKQALEHTKGNIELKTETISNDPEPMPLAIEKKVEKIEIPKVEPLCGDSIKGKTVVSTNGLQYTIINDIGRGLEVRDPKTGMYTIVKNSEISEII